jgi:GntR family transcriptional regulator
MAFQFIGKQDVYLEIANKYENYIINGLYKVGDKLPSVRAVAAELGVNPNTVAKAYSVLEDRSLIRALPKKGAFVIYGENELDESCAIDARHILLELKNKGIRYEDLISQAKEVFDKDD